ncbi:unnamed protein product [Effrenium voratum]|nr:unnamed protein product [Effrenium voratum]
MNRQPIPDAGAKLSMYYRKLTRRHSESVPQFLVREDTAHDEMWRALQRLLRERELDFSKFETSVEELKEFCGMRPEESVFMEGEDAESVISAASAHAGATEEESSAASAGKGKGKGLGTSTPTSSAAAGTAKAPKKRKDLIQRLMEKGLIPLAAMDIIRGWLVLEMSAANETEKALVKASAQNRLNYDNIRTALLTIHEDRGRFGGPKGVGAKSQNGYWQEAWRSDEHEQENEDAWWGEQGEDEWNLSDQYGYYQNDEWPADDPGESDAHQDQAEQEENPEVVQLMEEEKELQAMMAETQRSLDQARKAVAAAKKARGKRSPAKTKVTIDTGATVTAGGQEAVQDLVVALAKARPDMTVNVASDDRPWFRYGSGQWGDPIHTAIMSTAGSSDEVRKMKEMIQQAVKEAISEEKKKEPQAASKKKSNKPKTEFDESRKMTPTASNDPRMGIDTWPCLGKHVPQTGNNRWGLWEECQTCGVRLSYTPAVGAPAQTTHVDHGPTVMEALERLRAQGFEKKDLEARLVKHQIKIVSSEKVVLAPKGRSRPASKMKPKREDKEKALEVHDLAMNDDDEDFVEVQQTQKPSMKSPAKE